MNRRLTHALALAGISLLSVSSARADFVLDNAGPAGQGQAAVISDEPHVGPGDPGAPPKPSAPRLARWKPVRPAIVQGFGDAVPLAFACRQILPPGIRVNYGAGADPDMIVTWKGGDTWPHVLAAALKPLGLHMIQSGSTLTIKS